MTSELVTWHARVLHFKKRSTDEHPCTNFIAEVHDADGWRLHKVELTASPTGKSLHVYVDGKKYVPEAEGVES